MLTERMMKALTWRYFDEKEDVKFATPVERWPDPWRSVFLVAERYGMLDGYAAIWEACRAVAGDDDLAREWINEFRTAGEPLRYQSYEEIADTLPPIRWLWPNWIPRGLLTLMGGFQGTGKSYLALDLARVVTQGEEWPDGELVEKRGPVVYVEGEGVPQITVERMRQMGLDASRMFPLLPDNVGILNLLDQVWQDRVVDMVATLRPELLIVDSFSSVSSAGQNSVEDVNALLMFFVRLAQFADCGVVVIHHLRKPTSAQLSTGLVTIHDFRGSGHITAMSRSVLGYSVLPVAGRFNLREGRRHLAVIKTNLGEYPLPLGVELVTNGDGRKMLMYGEAPDGEEATAKDKCEMWLVETLEDAGEPVKPRDVIEMGMDEGYSRAIIYRAREKLNGTVINTKGRKHPGNRWALASWPSEVLEDDD